MLALECRSLVKRYRAGVRGCSAAIDALRGVDLHVRPGEVVGVVGAPGAGKSTLLLCASGAMRPDSGTVTWLGAAPGRRGADPVVGYVPDRPMHYPFLTVREVLEHHAHLRRLPPDECGHRVAAALARAGLERWQEARLADVPDPIRSRVAIAQALIGAPRLLVVDEPFAAPSAASRQELGDMLRSLAEGGTAVLVASRDVRALARMGGRIVVLSLGRIHGEADAARFQLADRVAEPRLRVAGHGPAPMSDAS